MKDMSYERSWPDGLVIRELVGEEYAKLVMPHHGSIFTADSPRFLYDDYCSDEEKEKLKALRSTFQGFRLTIGAFFNGKFAGWHFGRQDSPDTYYMTNSAVLPEFRRQKIYQRLLESTIELVTSIGFQCIKSSHHPSNNSVIIPKLKIGFWICGTQTSDTFGTLVNLVWYPKQTRKDAFEFRIGYKFATPELSGLTRLRN